MLLQYDYTKEGTWRKHKWSRSAWLCAIQIIGNLSAEYSIYLCTSCLLTAQLSFSFFFFFGPALESKSFKNKVLEQQVSSICYNEKLQWVFRPQMELFIPLQWEADKTVLLKKLLVLLRMALSQTSIKTSVSKTDPSFWRCGVTKECWDQPSRSTLCNIWFQNTVAI